MYISRVLDEKVYDIYRESTQGRWLHAIGRKGARKLIVIGLHPGLETSGQHEDGALTKVAHVAHEHGFDGFVMLYLYPVRCQALGTLPLSENTKAWHENLEFIDSFLAGEPEPVVWAAWGTSVMSRKYFLAAAEQLIILARKYPVQWKHLGPLSSVGHPLPPAHLNQAWRFASFPAESYRRKIST